MPDELSAWLTGKPGVKSFYMPRDENGKMLQIMGTNGAANLTTSTLSAYPNAVTLARIFVPVEHRGAGHATAMVEQLLADADESGTSLVLQIDPDEYDTGLTYEQLEVWYTSLGFERVKYGYYLRKPNKKES